MSEPIPKILIAESDRFIRESLCLGLGEGFEFVQAAGGAEVISLFREARPDAIILDYVAGRVEAAELCRSIRNTKSGLVVPIYVMGDEDDDRIASEAFSSGASDYLVKPVHLGFFARRIRRDIEMAARVFSSDVSTLEKAQAESELFRLFPEPALLLGAHGVVIMANNAYERVFDAKPLVTGRLISDFVPDFDPSQVVATQESYPELVSEVRGSVPVRMVCVRLQKGPWKDCVAAFFSERDTVAVQRGESIPGVSANILVLEDYDVVSRSVRRLLERAGHRVCVAASFDEACKAVSQAVASGALFDLALLDVSIPGSAGGGEVLRALRGMQPNLPAIVTSGAWHDPAMSRPAEFGFDATLRKPFSRDDLLEVVNKVLGKKKS